MLHFKKKEEEYENKHHWVSPQSFQALISKIKQIITSKKSEHNIPKLLKVLKPKEIL